MNNDEEFLFSMNFFRHNTEKVIYFLLLDRKLRQPTYDDPEDTKQRSRSGSRKTLIFNYSFVKMICEFFQRMCHKNVLIDNVRLMAT